MLLPMLQTLLCDINTLTNDGHRWTQEDKFQLESMLLLHTNEPLCLDPSPSVFFATNKLNFEKHKFNSHALKRCCCGMRVVLVTVMEHKFSCSLISEFPKQVDL